MFTQVLMVHFVRPPYSPYVSVITAGKPFKPLVDDPSGDGLRGDTTGSHALHNDA